MFSVLAFLSFLGSLGSVARFSPVCSNFPGFLKFSQTLSSAVGFLKFFSAARVFLSFLELFFPGRFEGSRFSCFFQVGELDLFPFASGFSSYRNLFEFSPVVFHVASFLEFPWCSRAGQAERAIKL